MPHAIDFERVVEMIFAPRVSDETVAAALPEARISLNAEAVSSGRLALACLVGHHRPSLLPVALAHAVDPMIAMGVETAEQFRAYAEFCVAEDNARGGPWWSEAAIAYFWGRLREHDLLIRRVLGEGLIRVATELDEAVAEECHKAGLQCLVAALASAESANDSAEKSQLLESLRKSTDQTFTTSNEWGRWLSEADGLRP